MKVLTVITVELDEQDLRPEIPFRDLLPTSAVKFEHLTEEAQAAVKAAGKGTFFRSRRTEYETLKEIHPPK